MALTDSQTAFLAGHPVAMTTVGSDGLPKAARIGVNLVDGKLWSSATADRVRTRRLRQDPRCTLVALEPAFAWLAVEATVTILEGDQAIEQSIRMFRQAQDRPTGPLNWFGGELEEDAFRQKLVDEQRLIYEFEPTRAYGLGT